MSNLEHYFGNLIKYGEDIPGNPNRQAITEEERRIVEICYDFILYNLFEGNREELMKWINHGKMETKLVIKSFPEVMKSGLALEQGTKSMIIAHFENGRCEKLFRKFMSNCCIVKEMEYIFEEGEEGGKE